MADFEIKNFFEFNEGKVRAAFSLNTKHGFYYDCKLVEGGSSGFFVVSNQSRSYGDEGAKKYVNAFGALKDTPAGKFFDEVAAEASRMLKAQKGNDRDQNRNNTTPNGTPPYDPDDDIPF